MENGIGHPLTIYSVVNQVVFRMIGDVSWLVEQSTVYYSTKEYQACAVVDNSYRNTPLDAKNRLCCNSTTEEEFENDSVHEQKHTSQSWLADSA